MGNDVIIFQHQYPGVGGAQLINHFVKRERKRVAGCDIIFIFDRRGPQSGETSRSDTPIVFIGGAHSRIMDHGSRRIIAM